MWEDEYEGPALKVPGQWPLILYSYGKVELYGGHLIERAGYRVSEVEGDGWDWGDVTPELV